MRIGVLLALTLCVLVGTATAGTVVIDHSFRGRYTDQPLSNARVYNNNYLAGLTGITEHNNWFIFDLSGVTGTIVDAVFEISTENYNSPDATETYTLFEVATDPSQLGVVVSLAIFNDLQDGTVYGSRVFSAADQDKVVSIPLPGAIGALNAAIGGDFAIGGHVSTTGMARTEWLFGTIVPDGPFTTRLKLTIPEPTVLLLFVVALAALALRR